MNEAYRQTDEYKQLLKEIQAEAPHLPLYLCEMAITFHKQFPQYYKGDKQYKKVLAEPIKPPRNAGEIILNSVEVGELTPEIEKQREEFFLKYMPQEEQSLIEEVNA